VSTRDHPGDGLSLRTALLLACLIGVLVLVTGALASGIWQFMLGIVVFAALAAWAHLELRG
jgi:hypothetical protein